ncbi:hypothetical protein [Saccharothrix sp. ST-888]|uniref:hypothetical protein n=1 Tax=Saccharothrix sp. ST-888 TaxID=1427391 RepID=UPI0005ED11FC|nr:hypothetical protein [Saccharothrix sp. ST-888]KJK60062.1 hypothetical protein UK12_01185 [Saccharothrix sp. ST-888]
MFPNRKATAALGALTLAGALFAAAPAEAATRTAPKGDGAAAICKRLPKTEKRVADSITRLNGDATVPGSIARLEQRVANAKTAGHTEIEKYLNDRLTFRKSLLPTLQTRQADLKSVATWCGAQGEGTAAAK